MHPAANDNTAPKGYTPAAPEPVRLMLIEQDGWAMLIGIPASEMPISSAAGSSAQTQT